MRGPHRVANGRGSAPSGARPAASEPVQQRGALLEVGVVPLEPGAVVVAHQREPDRARVGHLQQVAHEHEVAERLRHLLALVADHRRVHPVADERPAGDALALRDLALVVGEDQIGAAAVQVDGGAELAIAITEHSTCHPGRPDAERRAPRRLVGQRRLPQHEVEGIAAVRVVGVAAPRGGEADHLLVRVVRQLAEARERRARRSTRCRA